MIESLDYMSFILEELEYKRNMERLEVERLNVELRMLNCEC